MTDQTAALLQNLADKLGTTSQYLWAVLLKQAPIQGWIMAFEYVLTLAAIVAFVTFRKQISEAFTSAVESHGDIVPAAAFIGAAVFAVVSVVWLLACLFSFESMLTAFLNPEYWALNKVLSTVKK